MLPWFMFKALWAADACLLVLYLLPARSPPAVLFCLLLLAPLKASLSSFEIPAICWTVAPPEWLKVLNGSAADWVEKYLRTLLLCFPLLNWPETGVGISLWWSSCSASYLSFSLWFWFLPGSVVLFWLLLSYICKLCAWLTPFAFWALVFKGDAPTLWIYYLKTWYTCYYYWLLKLLPGWTIAYCEGPLDLLNTFVELYALDCPFPWFDGSFGLSRCIQVWGGFYGPYA